MIELNRPSRPALLWGTIFVCLVVLAYFVWETNLVRSGTSKTNGIFYRLRWLDGAQGQWGLEHGGTGAEVVTKEDLLPYLSRFPDLDADGWIKPVAGERYILKTLRETPEAQLTRELEGRPKGTVFRLGTNGTEEIIVLPDKPR